MFANCMNCGHEGAHYVGPHFGEPGFFACWSFCEVCRANKVKEGQKEDVVELLKDANLVSHTYVADDGYLSTAIHSDEEAAQRAADVLWDAGYRKVNLDE